MDGPAGEHAGAFERGGVGRGRCSLSMSGIVGSGLIGLGRPCQRQWPRQRVRKAVEPITPGLGPPPGMAARCTQFGRDPVRSADRRRPGDPQHPLAGGQIAAVHVHRHHPPAAASPPAARAIAASASAWSALHCRHDAGGRRRDRRHRRGFGAGRPGAAGRRGRSRPPAAPRAGGCATARNRRNRRTAPHRDAPPASAPSAPGRRSARPAPVTVTRGAVCGLALSAAPATSSAQRGSARRCRVCSDSAGQQQQHRQVRRAAGVTSAAKGWPSATVASVPARAARSSSARGCQAGRVLGPSALPYFVHPPSSMRHNPAAILRSPGGRGHTPARPKEPTP